MFRYSRSLVGKILLLLFIIIIIGLVAIGCVGFGAQQAGWSGVAVADGSLFFGSTGGSLVALDAENGGQLWPPVSFETSGSGGFGCAAPSTAVAIYGTPAIDGELVYIGGFDGKVRAINVETGAIRWVYPREGNLHSIIAGPLAAQGKVYIATKGGIVYSLNVATGDIIWQFEARGEIWSMPSIAGDTLFIGSFNKNLYALDVNTGEEKWQQSFESQGPIVSTPLVYDNTVYVASFDRHIYALDVTNGQKIWQFPAEGEAENKPEKWFWASPVISNSTIYAPNMDGKVYVLDANSGMFITAIDLGGSISSSAVVAGDKVFIATEEGNLYYIDTSSNQAIQLPDLGGGVSAPFTTGDGVVYVHTYKEEMVYAINAETGEVKKLWEPSKDNQ